ncbi:MAG: RNA methyltransferase [Myxococcota bacterium]
MPPPPPPPPFQRRSENWTDERSPDALPIRIVLVETSHPGNIGAAARAMKTMGLQDLYLVSPADFPSEEAERRAVGAVDVLNRAVVTQTLGEALADCQFVIGGSARPRELAIPVLDARAAGRRIIEEAAGGAPVAVLFGAERSGLTNEALSACSHRLHIPTSADFKSLNLAAAVQLVCYEILVASGTSDEDGLATISEEDAEPLPTHEEMEYFFQHLNRTLEGEKFSGPVNPDKINAKLRRFVTRGRPTDNELKLLHGLVQLMKGGKQRRQSERS